jgi:hypothetical protein
MGNANSEVNIPITEESKPNRYPNIIAAPIRPKGNRIKLKIEEIFIYSWLKSFDSMFVNLPKSEFFIIY